MNRKFWCSTLLTFGFAAFSLTASAQRLDGTLRGTVEDPSGAVVHDATVTATNEVTGSTHSTQTTSVGEYVFPNLLPGLYNSLSSTYANVTADQFLDAKQFTGGARQMQIGMKLSW